MPVMPAGTWFTIRWALADWRQVSNLEVGPGSFMPAWVFSTPLFFAAAAWVIDGCGALVKEDY